MKITKITNEIMTKIKLKYVMNRIKKKNLKMCVLNCFLKIVYISLRYLFGF